MTLLFVIVLVWTIYELRRWYWQCKDGVEQQKWQKQHEEKWTRPELRSKKLSTPRELPPSC